jgi:enoyl-[acyl-carrier protein] reductase II
MIDNGVDALMLEGSEAGGHIGHVSLAILLQEVLFEVDSVPVFVAGGIARGEMMAHLLLMGAAGVQMGTKFVMAKECKIHPNFKEAFIKARARDAVSTPAIGSELHVVAVRAIRNKGMDSFSDLQMGLIQKRREGKISQADAQYEVEKYWVGALRRAAQEGDIEFGSLMAGQSVGMMNEEQPLKEILDQFIQQGETELENIYNRLKCTD